MVCSWTRASSKYPLAMVKSNILVARVVTLVFLKWTLESESPVLQNLVGLSDSLEYFTMATYDATASLIYKHVHENFDGPRNFMILLCIWVADGPNLSLAPVYDPRPKSMRTARIFIGPLRPITLLPNSMVQFSAVEAEAKRVAIYWRIDSSVTSPACLPTNWTPSISLSMGHLRGFSAENTSLFSWIFDLSSEQEWLNETMYDDCSLIYSRKGRLCLTKRML